MRAVSPGVVLLSAWFASALVACGPSGQSVDVNSSPATIDFNASPAPTDFASRPATPTQLPAVSADLDLSGALSGHISQARLSQCSSRMDGDFTSFYASIYFEHNRQWYYLQLIGLNPLPVKGGTSPTGYSGPGRYQAFLDFREMTLLPGHMTIGQHAWGIPLDQMGSITISPDGRTIALGSFTGSAFRPVVISDHADLWPQRPDQTDPPPWPVPSPEQVVTLRGSWFCY